jgi:hypothetical protein
MPALHASIVHGLASLQSAFTTQAAHPEMGVCWQPLVELQLSTVQAFESLQLSAVPAAQTPAWQTSVPLQTVPSAHDVPFATAVCRQPKVASQVSIVQALPSSQLGGVPGVQFPSRQTSRPLHALASAHEVPLLRGTFRQPVTGSQLSAVQPLPSLQLGAAPGVQIPDWQVSAPLQTVASAQVVPFARLTCWQPVTGSQLSVVQTLPSLQLRAVPAVHTPPWQVSAPLQTLASAQEVPFSRGGFAQPDTGSQLSFVQGFESLQLMGGPAIQTLLWQVSAPLQTLPSLQAVPFGTPVYAHPVVGLQASLVHGLLSLQTSGVPAVQTPDWHVSLPLQRLPSAQAVPLVTGVVVHPVDGLQPSTVHTLPSLQTSGGPAAQTPA